MHKGTNHRHHHHQMAGNGYSHLLSRVCVCAVCPTPTIIYQTVSRFKFVYFPYPCCQCIIDLDGLVGKVLTADRDTRELAISQKQHVYYPRAHDNSCLVPAQGQGCNCTKYVMRREEEENCEGREVTGLLVNA